MKYGLKKFGALLLTLLMVSMLAFLAFQVIPGDPTTKILGTEATEEARAALRAELGLDGSVWVRYLNWLTAFLRGDMGISYSYRMPVAQMLGDKLPVTFLLSIMSFAMTVLISIPLCMRWEGVGAAIGTTLALFAGQYAMMNWYYYKKIGLDIPAYWKMAASITLKMAPLAIPAALLNLLLPGGGWLGLLVKIGMFSLLYLPYAWKLLLDDYEKGLARSILRRFKRKEA